MIVVVLAEVLVLVRFRLEIKLDIAPCAHDFTLRLLVTFVLLEHRVCPI